MLSSTIFRTSIRLLAYLGVFSILVHLFILMWIGASLGLERGYDDSIPPYITKGRPPQWFPDGGRIAFSHLGAVYVVDSGGSHLQLVDREAYTPRVSPDGSRIAYSAYKESGWLPWNHVESWEIMTANPDGSDHRKLTENATFDMDPVWSPDGTSIFFRSVSGDYDSTGISVVAANGSDSPVAINEVYTAGDDPIIKAPVLSPDGSRIAFSVGKHDLGKRLVRG